MTTRKGRHGRAIDAALNHGRTKLTDAHKPLIELCRDLAAQMDAAGPDGPSARLGAAYLSALKDLTRATASAAAERPAGKLAHLRAVHSTRATPKENNR